jgi:hypothetical protein
MPNGAHDSTHLFQFNIDRAILSQVVERMEGSPRRPLARGVGPKLSGVYALYWKGEMVYVGKATRELTKSKRDLRARLNEHVGKIEGRQNISLDEMQVRYLTFESEWWVFAAEYALITHYSPAWQNSGFGSKTPGRGRPGTERVSNWNEMFPPIDPARAAAEAAEESQSEEDDEEAENELDVG